VWIIGYSITLIKRGTLFIMLRGRLLRNRMRRIMGEIWRRRSTHLARTRRGARWSGPGWMEKPEDIKVL
jgi:hypothetical protein